MILLYICVVYVFMGFGGGGIIAESILIEMTWEVILLDYWLVLQEKWLVQWISW